jgi:hypothetical protein
MPYSGGKVMWQVYSAPTCPPLRAIGMPIENGMFILNNFRWLWEQFILNPHQYRRLLGGLTNNGQCMRTVAIFSSEKLKCWVEEKNITLLNWNFIINYNRLGVAQYWASIK